MSDVLDAPIPHLTDMLKVRPLADTDGISVADFLTRLNRAVEAAGVQFGEYEYADQTRHMDDPEEKILAPYRWLECSAVRGGSEGYYVHLRRIRPVRNQQSATLIAMAKCWSWHEALAIVAITTMLLDF